jgi:competence protein ComEC
MARTWIRTVVAVSACMLGAVTTYTAPIPEIKNELQVYFVDVEGGQATLFVTPEKESLLIDTGWPGNEGRDADRIVAAAKQAGLSKIDYVLITHFHDDHVGGAPQLAERFPVGTFIDHGENRETGNAGVDKIWQAYQGLLASGKYKHITAKPGDALPIKGVQVRVLSADGALIEKPLPGAGGANPACAKSEQRAGDATENPRSLGTLITFGKLRILDLGDLTWDKEMQLMCPENKIGHVDVYIVSHHGWEQSGSPALVHGIAPRVAIMDNGAKKGGSPPAWDIIKASPHLEGLWQLHFSEEGGEAHNAAPEFIANLQGPDAGNYLKLTAEKDGRFEMFNSRTNRMKSYAAR